MTTPLPPGFPRTFGPYVLLGPLAQGGMGEVFLASTRGVAGAVRLVVIKTLRPDLVKEPGYVTRFLDEARIVIQLQHGNICQVFDVGCEDGVHFFAMEHIAGTNLRRLIDVSYALVPTPIALTIMAEVLEGLDAAHRHCHTLTGEPLHIVHRDMSPHNVMLSYDGDVKLIDFGLASSELKMEHTGSQVVLGKIAYMSPEQARGEAVDARSDQFSAAVVLYELLTGERYYADRTQREIWSTAGAPFTPSLLANLDPDISAILSRALSFYATDRFTTCGDFSQALRTVLKLRFPFAERANLKSFVRENLADDRAETEQTLRTFGQLALQSMPEAETPSPLSGLIEPSLPSPVVARGWQPAVAAAAAGLLLGAIGVFVALGLRTPDNTASTALATTPMPTPTVAVSTPSPASASPTLASTGTVTATTSAAAATTPTLADAAPVIDARATGRATKATTPAPAPAAHDIEAPAWTRWSLDKKIAALDTCHDKCAKTLRHLRDDGVTLEVGAVDSCLSRCP